MVVFLLCDIKHMYKIMEICNDHCFVTADFFL